MQTNANIRKEKNSHGEKYTKNKTKRQMGKIFVTHVTKNWLP